MGRLIAFIYGVATYAVMFVAFLYLFGFLANAVVPKGIDDGVQGPLILAFAIDLGLILLFGLSHSVMARPGFKRWWTGMVPKSIERTTYVLVATAIFNLLFWQWRPITQTIWAFQMPWLQGLIWAIYGLGIVLLFASTFAIDHFDLFGLRQVTMNLLRKAHTEPAFQVTYFYRFVRHPIYVGWFLIFWATPHMTLGHLLFAAGMSAYILIAVRYEERDLVTYLGAGYLRYRERVPMFVPRVGVVHETIKSESVSTSSMS